MNYKIELLISLSLADFPSGSSINFYKDKLYIIGDDAKGILILDTEYRPQKTIAIFESDKVRIPKSQKPDFETSCIIQEQGLDHLLVLGSASTENRTKGILLPLEDSMTSGQIHFLPIHLDDFITRLKGIGEINIEGSTVVSNHIVLSNRANYSSLSNTLIITSDNFWKNKETHFTISQLVLPIVGREVLGVSELCYVESEDILLLTFSTELTFNSYDDGDIGDSYIGWITSAASKINSSEIRMDGMINLVEMNEEFKGEKIEGVCVEKVDDSAMTLHLVADNDRGQSRLFKLRMILSK